MDSCTRLKDEEKKIQRYYDKLLDKTWDTEESGVQRFGASRVLMPE